MTNHTIDPARAQWLADRRKGIGGSDVAAVLGLDPYKSPVELWMEKTGQRDDDVAATDAMHRGNFLEDAVADRYAALVAVDAIEKQIPHAVGIRRGNQDIRVIDIEKRRRCVEIKTVRRSVFFREWGAPWSDEVPDRALCQGLWYGNLDNADVIDFAVVVVPDDPDRVIGRTAEQVVAVSDFHVFQVSRNEQLERDLVALAEAWWRDYVLTKQPPPALSADDVSLLWAQHIKGETKQVDDELLAVIREYEQVSEQRRELDAKRDALRDRLMIAAGPAEALVLPDGVTPLVTMRTQERKAHEVKASTSRVLKLTKWWKRYNEQNPQQQKETP